MDKDSLKQLEKVAVKVKRKVKWPKLEWQSLTLDWLFLSLSVIRTEGCHSLTLFKKGTSV